MFGNIGFTEKLDLVAVAEDELVLAQVDAGLVAFQHVEAEQQVDVLALHDGEGAGDVGGADAQGRGVHAAEDLGGADAARDARVALVDEAHDAARLGARGRHDGRLRARVDERLHRVVVDLDGDVKHLDAAEDWEGVGVSMFVIDVIEPVRVWERGDLVTFRAVLVGVLQILLDGLFADDFFNLTLRLDVEWVFVQ